MTENEIREYIVNECQNTRCQYLRKDNECVEDGNCFEVKRQILAILEEIQQYRAIGTVEELKSMKENGAFTGVELAQLAAMQMRLKEYSTIGTIDEFKALKEKNVADEVKENNKQLVCEIKIDAEMMRKIIDKKMTQIELDIQEIRAKAIDEFAKQLKSDEFQKYDLDMVFETSRDLSYSNCINAFCEYVDKIAEEMRGVE